VVPERDRARRAPRARRLPGGGREARGGSERDHGVHIHPGVVRHGFPRRAKDQADARPHRGAVPGDEDSRRAAAVHVFVASKPQAAVEHPREDRADAPVGARDGRAHERERVPGELRRQRGGVHEGARKMSHGARGVVPRGADQERALHRSQDEESDRGAGHRREVQSRARERGGHPGRDTEEAQAAAAISERAGRGASGGRPDPGGVSLARREEGGEGGEGGGRGEEERAEEDRRGELVYVV